ncbi:carbon-nitrogen hydrolase family protein [Zobellella iuensis]|uniref:Carbon-nitrogen hydrolase family protein n=1 Tax=Zobellella iuensis TaxID=2803811 RepID=A0ABS1QTE8_9GAMM|nr:carbon-nitrogen hydrolase family protein [Zobellella iuensis]
MNNSTLIVGLAQIQAEKGDLVNNLKTHLEFIAASARLGADLVAFPELSLTGYELELAAELALEAGSSVLTELSRAAVRHRIVVVAGCPLKNGAGKPFIGAVICFSDGRVEYYAKQYLHPGEEQYCAPGHRNYQFPVKGHRVALAICADFGEARHGRDAKAAGAGFYLASALISEQGFAADSRMLSSLAARLAVPVLLCNHVGATGGWVACGNSGFWDGAGRPVFAARGANTGLVLCTLGEEPQAGRFYPIQAEPASTVSL